MLSKEVWGHSQCSGSSRRFSVAFRSGLCAAHLRFSTPNLANHVFPEITLSSSSDGEILKLHLERHLRWLGAPSYGATVWGRTIYCRSGGQVPTYFWFYSIQCFYSLIKESIISVRFNSSRNSSIYLEDILNLNWLINASEQRIWTTLCIPDAGNLLAITKLSQLGWIPVFWSCQILRY